MHVHYKGKIDELTPEQRELLQARYSRLSRHLDGKSEKEAHVILTTERYLHNAEITVNFLDHGLVGRGSDPELFTAISDAVNKLEKQVNRLLGKRRESYREGKDKFRAAGENGNQSKELPVLAVKTRPISVEDNRIHEVDITSQQKPMTLEEALMHIEGVSDYFPYIDVTTDHLAVLIRRNDGHFDLVRCQ